MLREGGATTQSSIKRLRCAWRGRALVPAAGHQTDAEKNGEVYVFIENQWDCKEVQVFNRCRDGNVGPNPFWHNSCYVASRPATPPKGV